jgi:hypothetical protein
MNKRKHQNQIRIKSTEHNSINLIPKIVHATMTNDERSMPDDIINTKIKSMHKIITIVNKLL